jgi:hypothetical protein
MTYQIIITEETANVSVTTDSYPIIVEYNATNLSANGAYGNSNVASYLASNVSIPILTTANVRASYFLGNGSQLTGLPATYSDANVVTLLGAFGSNTISTTGNLVGGNISGTHLGSGAALSAITGANVSGTVANATFATSAATATSATTAGTVTTAAQANITSVGVLSSLSVTGNITTAANFVGNGAALTGIVSSYGNANVAANLAAFANNPVSTTGNVTAGYVIGNGSLLSSITGANVTGTVPLATAATTAGTVTTAAQANITSVGVLTSLSSTGNITGANINGNGSGLSSITAANISGTVANATYATNAGIATFATTANAVAGANVSGTVANATFATSAATATTAGTVTTAAQGNITSVGTLTNLDVSGNAVIGGNLTVNGDTVYTNVTSFAVEDPVIEMGRGANLAPLTSDDGKDRGERLWYYSGSEKSAFTGYDNSAGRLILAKDVTIANEIVTVVDYGTTQVGALESASVNATGNITGANINGNGSGLSSLTGANVTGTVANATFATSAGSATTATTATTAGTVTTAAQANITSVGVLTSLSSTGNITGANINGNGSGLSSITGANVTGTVAAATSATSATSATTAGTVTTAAQGNITSVGTLTSLSVTGNIATSANFVGNAAALTNIPAGGADTQIQFNNGGVFAGNAAMTFNSATGNITQGNIVTNGSQIQGLTAMNVSTGQNPGRIIIGDGYNGNTSVDVDATNKERATRLAVWGSHTQGSETVQSSGLAVTEMVTLTGNTNAGSNGSRMYAATQALFVGGGASAFVRPEAFAYTTGGLIGALNIGSSGNVLVGNTVVTAGATVIGGISVNAGGTLTNGIGVHSTASTQGGNLVKFAAFAPYTSYSSGTGPTDYSVLYNPSSTASNGTQNSNGYRQATNYYFLRNEDAVAQNQLGSLRSYTEFSYVNSTSGAITISKLNGQVQQIELTGNVTGITLSDFVTTASDSVNTDFQADTVTVAFNQGATGGYGVTFPAQSSTVKYAGNVTALQSTAANSISLVSISAMYLNSATTYLITISPGFV